MKVVLDTTILVRANEHSHGLARELLIGVVDGEHTLLLSNEMLHELARVKLNPLVAAPIRDVNDAIVMQPPSSARPKFRAWSPSWMTLH